MCVTFVVSSTEQTSFRAGISKSSLIRATGNQFWKKSQKVVTLMGTAIRIRITNDQTIKKYSVLIEFSIGILTSDAIQA